MRGGLAGLLLAAGVATGCSAIAGEMHAPLSVVGEAPVPADIERTAFQAAGVAGTLEMPPGEAGFAFSALCGPVLAHVGLEPLRLVQKQTLCSIATQRAFTLRDVT